MAKPKFPHFTIAEADALESFQKTFPYLTNWQYSVRYFTKPADKPDHLTVEEYKAIRFLSAKRADAMFETARALWIVEVKKVLRHSAIGELITYKHFTEKQLRPRKIIKLLVVASFDDPTMHPVFDEQGMWFWTEDGVRRIPQVF